MFVSSIAKQWSSEELCRQLFPAMNKKQRNEQESKQCRSKNSTNESLKFQKKLNQLQSEQESKKQCNARARIQQMKASSFKEIQSTPTLPIQTTQQTATDCSNYEQPTAGRFPVTDTIQFRVSLSS